MVVEITVSVGSEAVARGEFAAVEMPDAMRTKAL
jgi:hypothetical protein